MAQPRPTDTKQATCEDRIDRELTATLQTLRNLWEHYQQDPEAYHPEEETNLDEYGLDFSYVEPYTFKDQRDGYWRYQLSWGGPSDEFRIWVDSERDIQEIEYWFMDWYDGAHRKLAGDDFDLLHGICTMFLDCQP